MLSFCSWCHMACVKPRVIPICISQRTDLTIPPDYIWWGQGKGASADWSPICVHLWWHRTWRGTDWLLRLAKPHCFISACGRSERSVKMVIRWWEWMLLFWELDLQAKPPVKMGQTWLQNGQKCMRKDTVEDPKQFYEKEKTPLVIPGMGKMCIYWKKTWRLMYEAK